METTKKKLSNYLKVSYGLADVGFNFMVTMSNAYLLMFFTDVALMDAAVVGTLMMVGRILDSISPPIIGGMIEKSNMRWGKYRSWILIGTPLVFVFNLIIFTELPFAMPLKAILSCIVYALFCISTNIVYTGYTSLNSSLTDDPKERLQLSMARGQGNAIGKSLAGFLIVNLIVLFGGSKTLNQTGFLWTAVIVGLVCCLGYVNLLNASKGRDITGSSKDGVKKEKFPVSEMLKAVFGNRNLMILFTTDVLRILAMLLIYAMFPFFFNYVLNNKGGESSFLGIINILAFVGATSVPFITKYLTKRKAYIIGNTLLAVCLIIAAVFNTGNAISIIVIVSIGYIGYSWGNVVNTAMYADVVDEEMKRTGKNVRGLYFSMFQFSIKIAAIFSTGVAAFGLSIVGYKGNMVPTENVITGIRFISMGMPAVLLLIGAVLLLFYNIDKKKQKN